MNIPTNDGENVWIGIDPESIVPEYLVQVRGRNGELVSTVYLADRKAAMSHANQLVKVKGGRDKTRTPGRKCAA